MSRDQLRGRIRGARHCRLPSSMRALWRGRATRTPLWYAALLLQFGEFPAHGTELLPFVTSLNAQVEPEGPLRRGVALCPDVASVLYKTGLACALVGISLVDQRHDARKCWRPRPTFLRHLKLKCRQSPAHTRGNFRP